MSVVGNFIGFHGEWAQSKIPSAAAAISFRSAYHDHIGLKIDVKSKVISAGGLPSESNRRSHRTPFRRRILIRFKKRSVSLAPKTSAYPRSQIRPRNISQNAKISQMSAAIPFGQCRCEGNGLADVPIYVPDILLHLACRPHAFGQQMGDAGFFFCSSESPTCGIRLPSSHLAVTPNCRRRTCSTSCMAKHPGRVIC